MLEQTLKILQTLIAFDTTSRNSNLALIEYIVAYFEQRGVASELVHNADKSKANLYATIGPADKPGLVLSGHTDVVPTDGQNWSSDPFTTVQRDGKLFGRGSCDMKGFIAVCLAMVDHFKAADLPIPIHLAFSYDEEIGCLGVRDLLDDLAKRPVLPLACIVGEPTDMQIITAHKGISARRCQITGCAGHSSLPEQGVNAIYQAAKLIGKLNQIEAKIKRDGPFDARFTPPYTSVHVGTIQGGTAINIIPEHCEFDFEFRNLPQQEPDYHFKELKQYADEELLPTMREVSADTDIQWRLMASFPGLDTSETADITQWSKKVLQANTTSGAVSYGTEAGLIAEIGIPAIVCGPGSIEQAHRPDEYVEIAQLAQCIDFMQNMTTSLASGKIN
ncbi:MAG: acetylornithine deacetylase [Methylococcales bacterium]|nr:acetylornithine deacetylase [Methylococcales bacterium]